MIENREIPNLKQRWKDLLFLHWVVPAEALQKHLPPNLELDLFENQAWVGVIAFKMDNISFRGSPGVPFFSSLLELNVRTYVKCRGLAGVYFLSLDATNAFAVWVARRFFHLNYLHATIDCAENDGMFTFESERTHRRSPKAAFRASFRATGRPYAPEPSSLAFWLVERYCLFTQNKNGELIVGKNHHLPWHLKDAEAKVEKNTLGQGFNLALESTPAIVHFSDGVEVAFDRFKLFT
jgi:uncharacterized protein YqjF (DUF2071 family)